MSKTDDLIKREYILNKLSGVHLTFDDPESRGFNAGITMAKQMTEAAPAAYTVSPAAYRQALWERDTAMQQLESYGVGFCEKADVVKVVRCKDCDFQREPGPFALNDIYCNLHRTYFPNNGFCHSGERRKENDTGKSD